ncbi:MAG: SigB/SigF/SigG family RNA polymerase sigma factor [Actinobacteria bacterium]|nr:SigB/SigF/SigG family RNA polymerase sigma factor [Actinomycetota bacterium]
MSDRETDDALFLRRDGDPAARDALVVRHRGLAAALARRFTGRGEALEDLIQVATIGLINAVDRFDVARGAPFRSYASATIVGELKRHLRDRGWSVRVPRGLQERSLLVSGVRTRLSGRLGRSPTIAEIAADADLETEEVVEALQAAAAYRSASIDAPFGGDPDAPTLASTLPADDEAEALAERLAVVAPAIRSLPERERHILFLRFYRDLTQTEIAEEVGISQMHVSRLLARALQSIREALGPG